MKSNECKALKKVEKCFAKKISLSVFILLVLFVQVIISDTIIYFAHVTDIIGNIIGLILNIILITFFIRKKIILIENNFNKWDLIFFTILLIGTTATIIFPDQFWDSYSYHIYLQEEPFADKINDDFFPGRTLTSFVYPIVDRIFGMFRSTLGFRLGTLPGYLILIVMFYQIKKILNKLLNEKIDDKYLSVLSMLPLATFIILQQLGTYYIDNFSIVVLLEFSYIILFEIDNIFKEKVKLYFLAFWVGIGICIKITNGIYMLVPLLYLLIKNIKDIKYIKWYDYILLVIVAVIPMLPYLLDAIIQTGSPVFPYYNTIFKSQYFAEENWLDDRFGPKNIIQFLLWPIYIILNPRKAYEVGETDIAFASGYIIAIIYLLGYIGYMFYKKIFKKENIKLNSTTMFIINLLYFYIVWEKFIIGYTRYAGIIAVMSTILIIKLFLDCILNKKLLITIMLGAILLVTSLHGINQYAYFGSPINYLLAYRGNPICRQRIKQNLKRTFDNTEYKYDIDGIWGVIDDDSAVPEFLNVDDRLVQLEYGFKTGLSDISQKIYWENVLNNDIYVPLYTFKLEEKLQFFDICHFEIIEITDTLTDVKFLQDESIIYIVKVKYNENLYSGNKDIFEQLLNEREQQN